VCGGDAIHPDHGFLAGWFLEPVPVVSNSCFLANIAPIFILPTGASLEPGGITVDIKKNGYRVPIRAEWEYACRGGTTNLFYRGADSSMNSISKYAWYSGDVTADSTTQPVATRKPNGYRLNGGASGPMNHQLIFQREGVFPERLCTIGAGPFYY
jgi:hypothetical protein